MDTIIDIVAQCANHCEMDQQKRRALRDAFACNLEDCLFQRVPTGALREAVRVATAPVLVSANTTLLAHMAVVSTPAPRSRTAHSTPLSQTYAQSYLTSAPASVGTLMTVSETTQQRPLQYHSNSEQKQNSAKTSIFTSFLQPLLLSLLQGQVPSSTQHAQSYCNAAAPANTAANRYQDFKHR